jgi:hypothetical protein
MAVIKSTDSTKELIINEFNAALVSIVDSNGDSIDSGIGSDVNSSTTALNTGITFTGTGENIVAYPSVIVTVKTDQDGTLYMEFSPDNSNWDSSLSFSVTANVNEVHRLSTTRMFYRTRFTNTSAGNQTFFRLQTLFGSQPSLTSTINGILQQDADSLVAREISEELDVAQGKRTGVISNTQFGINLDIDIAATEDIWSQGGTWVAPTTARLHDLVSTSANDTSAGTGARTVSVEGLNSSYAIISETITLNGVANVPTVNTYVIVNKLTVLTGGSGGTNAGIITATAQTDATVTNAISIGAGQSTSTIYQVPAGYKGYIQSFNGSIQVGGVINVNLLVKPFGGVFNLKDSIRLNLTGTSCFQKIAKYPLEVTEKSIIKLTGTVDVNNTDCNGGYDLIIIKS